MLNFVFSKHNKVILLYSHPIPWFLFLQSTCILIYNPIFSLLVGFNASEASRFFIFFIFYFFFFRI